MNSRKNGWAAALMLLVIGGLPRVAFCQSVDDRVAAIVRELAPERHGGIYDFGRLLKPGGEAELKEQVRRFDARGLRVWFVTIPPDEPADRVANGVYSRLAMNEHDLLIVFNSRQVYGRSLALKGKPEQFREAFEESKRAFQENYAKGLAEYATRLAARIDQRQAEIAAKTDRAKTRAASGRRMTLLVPLLILAAFGLIYGIARYQRISIQGRTYEARMREASDLLGEAALEAERLPGRRHDQRVADLSERLTELRRSPQREDTRAVDLLISDARGFLVDVRKDEERSS